MNFKEFWKVLQIELQHEKQFTTMKQNKKFTAYLERKQNGEMIVRIVPESGKPRAQFHIMSLKEYGIVQGAFHVRRDL